MMPEYTAAYFSFESLAAKKIKYLHWQICMIDQHLRVLSYRTYLPYLGSELWIRDLSDPKLFPGSGSRIRSFDPDLANMKGLDI